VTTFFCRYGNRVGMASSRTLAVVHAGGETSSSGRSGLNPSRHGDSHAPVGAPRWPAAGGAPNLLSPCSRSEGAPAERVRCWTRSVLREQWRAGSVDSEPRSSGCFLSRRRETVPVRFVPIAGDPRSPAGGAGGLPDTGAPKIWLKLVGPFLGGPYSPTSCDHRSGVPPAIDLCAPAGRSDQRPAARTRRKPRGVASRGVTA
jgi:hypothetical protein